MFEMSRRAYNKLATLSSSILPGFPQEGQNRFRILDVDIDGKILNAGTLGLSLAN